MISEFYKSADKTKCERVAYDYFVTSLLDKNLSGTSDSVSPMDMESKSPSDFVPSMMYTMMYVNPTKSSIGRNNFYDVAPLILCTSCDGKNVTGINFNFIPSPVRAIFLDFIMSVGEDYYEDESDNEFRINDKLAFALSSPATLNKIVSLFKEKFGFDLSPCIRTYDRNFILKSRMIEIDMWKYVPFLVFKDAVRGINLADIQQSVLKNK